MMSLCGKQCLLTPLQTPQGLNTLHREIQSTWNMLDKDGDGSVTKAELADRLSQLDGISDAEIEAMLKKAPVALCFHATESMTTPVVNETISERSGQIYPDCPVSLCQADTDFDGSVDYQEFVNAFHSSEWTKARLMGKAAAQFDGAVKQQAHSSPQQPGPSWWPLCTHAHAGAGYSPPAPD